MEVEDWEWLREDADFEVFDWVVECGFLEDCDWEVDEICDVDHVSLA